MFAEDLQRIPLGPFGAKSCKANDLHVLGEFSSALKRTTQMHCT